MDSTAWEVARDLHRVWIALSDGRPFGTLADEESPAHRIDASIKRLEAPAVRAVLRELTACPSHWHRGVER